MVKRALVLGNNCDAPYHPLSSVVEVFREILQDFFMLQFADALEDLQLLAAGSHDLCISYYDLWEQDVPAEMIKILEHYISRGGGFLAVHNGISLQQAGAFQELIGAQFISHPPYQPINYRVLDHGHPIMKGVTDFTIEEELYLYNSRVTESFEILLEGRIQDATSSPALWARTYGHGKIVYCALGHDQHTFVHPSVRRILLQSALWAATTA